MFRFLIPPALALAAFAQDQAPRPAGGGINFFSLENEIAMGVSQADAVRRDTKALDSVPVQQYVARLGQRLAAEAGGPTFAYSFSVVAAAPSGGEPIALPGGPIFIPASLILEARDEAEFAGMLAHAIGHIAERHYTRRMTRENLMQIGMIAAANATDRQTAAAIQQGTALSAPLADAQLRRAFELQADRRAVQTMAQAGYDPAALIAYVRRMQPDGSASSPIPPVEQRVLAIQAAIGVLPAQTYRFGGEFQAIQDTVRVLTAQ